MKLIQVSYTILDGFEVPDSFTYDEIERLCVERFYNGAVEMEYNDLEWSER